VIRRATALLAVLFVALPAGVVLANHHVAAALGRTLGREAALALGRLPARRAVPPAELLPPIQEEAATPAAVSELESGKPGKSSKPAKPAKRRGKAPLLSAAERGVFVSAETVLGLASRGVIPRAVPVPASESRPAGLRLVGAAALGVGLREGDILTHVLGAPAGSVGAVIDAVVRARAGNARVISGTFWREGRNLSLVVEQPYLATPAPTPAPP
jgi:S1-C subfamily serine protease